jgi:hypothetical protein
MLVQPIILLLRPSTSKPVDISTKKKKEFILLHGNKIKSKIETKKKKEKMFIIVEKDYNKENNEI